VSLLGWNYQVKSVSDSTEQVCICPNPKTDNKSLEEEKKGVRKKAKAVN